MVDPSHTFHIADYAVFGLTILISIGIGIYYALSGGRQRTTSEYLVGGRTMQFIPVAISLMVSFESSIMMLGLPAEAYVYGIQWWWSCVGFLVAQLLSIIMLVPLIHPLQITSAYEYLQFRFNSTAVRLLGTALGMLTYVWYMGIVLFGPAIALEAVTGFPQWGSIFVIAFVAVIYTSIGGLKAVIWTDVFQAFVMYAGMLAVLIKGTIDVGGPSKVWEVASAGGFDPDPTVRHTFWALFFGSAIRGFGLAFNQSTVQRVSATKTQKEAKWVLLIVAPCFFFSLSMACYEGIVAYAYYETKGCDPLESNKISNPNQIIPFTVMDIFMSLPGMPGLFLASLFSASLSTLSSGLSSLSALLWADIVKPRIGEISELKATIIAKVSVVVFGLIGCGIALLVSIIGGPMTQIAASLLGAFAGPLTGLFLLGCFSPWANAKGAFLGGMISLVFSSWLSMGKNFAKGVKKEPWLSPASTSMCYVNTTSGSVDAMLEQTTPAGLLYSGSVLKLLNGTAMAESYEVGYGLHYTDAALSSAPGAQYPYTTTVGIEVMYSMSYLWIAPIGILTTLIVGTIISVITEGEVNPRYIINFFDQFCCYMPECFLKRLRFDDYRKAAYDDYTPPLKGTYLDTELVVVASDGKANNVAKEPLISRSEPDGYVTRNGVRDSDVIGNDAGGRTATENGITKNNITGNEVVETDVTEDGSHTGNDTVDECHHEKGGSDAERDENNQTN
ncbi:hypothetical protein BaRGS_00031162 [Batillaria attramentaria]|uniref:Uncharacterized protein n=1 Tax=Batillaria attramentaria TaxID=370345 RepID=A0ABD0JSI3_9CAEN